MSVMASFCAVFAPRDVLCEIWDLIESVSEGFPTYSSTDMRSGIILLIQVRPKKVYSREIKKYQVGSVSIRTHADYDNFA